MSQPPRFRLRDWIEGLQGRGRHAFSYRQLSEAFPAATPTALRRSLDRQLARGKIVSIYKGYYLIISPQYASRGILPPELFLDGLMEHLQRPYYLGLLNAAAYHGVGHKRPQEYMVLTTFPSLRPTRRNGLQMHYLSRNRIEPLLLERRKTESGYLYISNPMLTAADLMQYHRWVGGVNRALEALQELGESLRPEMVNTHLMNYVATSTTQRLGFVMDRLLKKQDLADALYGALHSAGKLLKRIDLKPSAQVHGVSFDARWKVALNVEIDLEA